MEPANGAVVDEVEQEPVSAREVGDGHRRREIHQPDQALEPVPGMFKPIGKYRLGLFDSMHDFGHNQTHEYSKPIQPQSI